MFVLSRRGRERRLRQQASVWALRLSAGVLGAADQRRLDRWLTRDARHGPALADAEMAWALAGECRDSPLFARPVPRAWRVSWRGGFAQPLDRRALVSWRGAVAALCLLWFTVWQAGGQDIVAPWLADYRSGVGEIRSLDLPDGSRVLLGSNSALDLEYDAVTRRVRLLRGEAIFSPAPTTAAEARKFVVAAAGGSMTALGTRYVVRREDAGRAWVGVLRHRIEVSLDRAPLSGHARAMLAAGESAVFSHAGGIARSPVAPSRAADWADGYLAFEGVPFKQVLQRIGDFRPGLLVLANRTAARQPVNGLFHLDNLDDALATLCSELRLTQVHLPGITLLY